MADITNKLPLEKTGENYLSALSVNNTKYLLKDYNARNAISAIIPEVSSLQEIVKGGVHYEGLAQAETGSGIPAGFANYPEEVSGSGKFKIDGKGTYAWGQTPGATEVSVETGDIILVSGASGKGNVEYIYDGTKWNKFGSINGLGDLAFKNSASGNYTYISVGDTTKTNLTVNFSNASIDLSNNISGGHFSGTQVTPTGSFTATSQLSVTPGFNGTETKISTYLSTGLSKADIASWLSTDAIKSPAALSTYVLNGGDVNVSGLTIQSFDALTSTTSGTYTVISGGLGGKATTFSGTYTPAGSIALSTLNVSANVESGKPQMSFGTRSSVLSTATVNNEVLSFTTGSVVTAESGTLSTSVVSSVAAVLSGTPKFNGSSATINTSGTPLVSANSGTLSCLSASTSQNITLTASGYVKLSNYVTGVTALYSGTASSASIGAKSGGITNKLESVAYTPTGSIDEITWTPTGDISINPITPSGSISGYVKISGTATGSQDIGHTHGVTTCGTSGTVTVS